MAIAVVCPGCKKSFRVNDKYAGKKGPCPKCKTTIEIPKEAGDVKVHAPEEYGVGGKDSKGRPVAKPIPRPKQKASVTAIALGLGGAVLVLLAAWLLQRPLSAPPVRLLGLLLVSPPLCYLGYVLLRDQDDLDPFRGQHLWIRSLICAIVYVGLWVAFYFVPGEYVQEMWQWFYVAPPLLILGALGGLACYDLDMTMGFLHYCFYLLSTILLRLVAGQGWPWETA